MERKKRSIGVTILGIYFILQGWIALGYTREYGSIVWLAVALSAAIGIGILKLYKVAYVIAIIISAVLLVGSLIGVILNVGQPAMGTSIAGIIVGSLLLTFLTQKSVREQFKDAGDVK